MVQPASFILSLDQDPFVAGQNITVSVLVNTGGVPVNTVFARIQFPEDKLEFIQPDFVNSSFPNIIERKVTDNVIKLTSFSTDSFSGTDALFARLQFKTKINGDAAIQVLPISKIHADDGKGTDIADPGKLPSTLTFFIGTRQEPIYMQGETIVSRPNNPAGILQPQPSNEPIPQNQGLPLSGALTNPGNPQAAITDYSTFAGTPKIYPPGVPPPTPFLASGAGIFLLAIVFLILLGLILIIRKRRMAPNVKNPPVQSS